MPKGRPSRRAPERTSYPIPLEASSTREFPRRASLGKWFAGKATAACCSRAKGLADDEDKAACYAAQESEHRNPLSECEGTLGNCRAPVQTFAQGAVDACTCCAYI